MKKFFAFLRAESLIVKGIQFCWSDAATLRLIICLMSITLLLSNNKQDVLPPEPAMVNLQWEQRTAINGESIWALCARVTPNVAQHHNCMGQFVIRNRESFPETFTQEKDFEIFAGTEYDMPN